MVTANQLAVEIKETMATMVAILEAELMEKNKQIFRLEGTLLAERKTLEQANKKISGLEDTISELILQGESA